MEGFLTQQTAILCPFHTNLFLAVRNNKNTIVSGNQDLKISPNFLAGSTKCALKRKQVNFVITCAIVTFIFYLIRCATIF